MFSTVLDISIGLIFIFLMYSIFASILAEIIATSFGMRARMLRLGISHMLTDLKGKEEFFGAKRPSKAVPALRVITTPFFWVMYYFIVEPSNFKRSAAGKFYQHPSIRSFSKKDWKGWGAPFNKTKPSYISKEAFSKVLTDMLRKQGKGIHDWGKISFSITHNACHLAPEVHSHLVTMLEQADDDMEVFIDLLEEWYEETMQRINGWYKRKMRSIILLMGFFVAITFNTDTFEIVNTLSKDPNARGQIVQQAVTFVGSSNEKPEAFTLQDINNSRNYIGNGWTFESEVKTIDIKSSTYHQLSSKLDSIKKIQEILDKDDKGEGSSNLAIIETLWGQIEEEIDNLNAGSDTLHIDAIDKLEASYFLLVGYQEDLTPSGISNEQRMPGAYIYQEKDFNELKQVQVSSEQYKDGKDILKTWKSAVDESQLMAKASPKDLLSKINQDREKKIVRVFDGKASYVLHAKVELSFWEKAGQVFSALLPFNGTYKFFGILITVLAINLGAPFWFDLLKKLVAVRGTGVNPNEEKRGEEKKIFRKKAAGEKSRMGKTIKDADPVDIVLEQNRNKWEAMPGVIAVNKVRSKRNEDHDHVVEVVHHKGYALPHIGKFIKPGPDTDATSVRVSKKEGKVGLFLDNEGEYGKYSIEGPNGKIGTMGGLFQVKGEKTLCILTCAHVVGQNDSSLIYQGKEKIKSLGKLRNLMFSNLIDAAIIEVPTLKESKIKKLIGKDLIFDEVYAFNSSPNIDDVKVLEEKDLRFYTMKGELIDSGINLYEMNYDYPLKAASSHVYSRKKMLAVGIGRQDSKQPVAKGDSGAILFYVEQREDGSERKVAVGMVVGGEEKVSPDERGKKIGYGLLIPMDYTMESLHIELINESDQ